MSNDSPQVPHSSGEVYALSGAREAMRRGGSGWWTAVIVAAFFAFTGWYSGNVLILATAAVLGLVIAVWTARMVTATRRARRLGQRTRA